MNFDYDLETFPVRFGHVSLKLTAARNFEAKRSAGEAASSDLPFGSALWPAALALCDTLVKRGEALRGLRAIELGCGLGLGSLVCKAIGVDIIATDYHPDMQGLFARNAEQNGLNIPYARLDWALPHALGRFPLIIASDVLYENHFPNLILDTIERTLTDTGEVLLADPQRQNLIRFELKAKERGYVISEHLFDVAQVDTHNTEGAMAGFVPKELVCKVLSLKRG